MSPFLAADGEDVLAEIRPHPASFAARYLADLAWLALGWLAAWVQVEAVKQAGASATWTGLAAFATFAVLHAVGAKILKAPGLRFGVGVALVATGALVATQWSLIRLDRMALLVILIIAATFFSFIRTEFDRVRRTLFVTSRRIVLRKGLGRVQERAIDLDHVQSVRAVQGTWGQLFRYGTIVLTLHAKGRTKPGMLAPAETLHGIPKWNEVKYRLEAVLEERTLPPKERVRHAEERRLKDSMRALAGWAGTQNP